MNNETTDRSTGSGIGSRANWIHFLFSGVLLLGSMAYYQTTQAESLRRDVAQLRRDNTSLRTNLSKSDQSLERALTGFHQDLEQLHSELVSSHAETGQSLAHAQEAATRHADALISKLEKKRRQQEDLQRQLTAELNKVKQSAVENTTRLNGISNDVGNVKSEVESVKSVASLASSNLQKTHGDLGVISGLIATNSEEIQMLRDLGDRNVYEFTLAKSDGTQRVGDIQVSLDRTDPKRNRFTLQILAADQRVEKRDKSVNEPVQFYVPGKGGQPYELVVNEVSKNTVKGYITSPKITIARNQ